MDLDFINVNIKKKNFDKIRILEDIKLSIKDSEFLSIIGPSGCGKTTLLKIIASLDKDFIGEINLKSSNIGYMFQENLLLPWLTIKENLLLFSKDKDLFRIEKFLSFVDLKKEILDKYPNEISGGMARRVALIRTFINEPKIVLLDEPFLSLDFPTAVTLKKNFLSLCKEFKSSVILVTHDLSEAIYLSNRILFFTKNPAKIIYEYENENNQEFDMEKIDFIKNKILKEYPNILEGVI